MTSHSKLGAFRSSLFAVAMAGGLLASTVPAAHANLVVAVSEDGGAFSTLVNDGTNAGPDAWSFSGSYFTISGGGALSNSPGTSTLSKVLASTLDITNDTSATHTIQILVGAQDFTSPSGGVKVDSHIGGSVVGTNAANSLSFMSCIDSGNNDALGACGAPTSQNTAAGTPSVITGSFDSDEYLTLAGLGVPYSITQSLSLTLGGGGEMNFATNTTLNPVPEPSVLSLLGVGFIALGVASRKRSRSRSSTPAV